MDIHNPSVILMDEPTNHLDSSGRQRLYDWVEKWRSTLLVVSHDRTLLNLLPEICELEKHQISYYGGNYEFYKEQKTLMQEALQQRIEEKEKALRTARKVARETAERRDKQNVRGEKRNLKKGVPRIVLNGLQSKSEKSTAKLSGAHQEKTEKLTDERNQLRSSLSPTAALKTDFNSPGLHTGKILVTAKEINFGYHPDQPQLWRAPLSFQLKSGDRLRIEGGNGSGKTTLLKIITGQLQPLKGTLIQIIAMATACVQLNRSCPKESETTVVSTILLHIIHQSIKVTFIQRILYNSVFLKFTFCKFFRNSCCYFPFILKYFCIIKFKKCVKLCFIIYQNNFIFFLKIYINNSLNNNKIIRFCIFSMSVFPSSARYFSSTRIFTISATR